MLKDKHSLMPVRTESSRRSRRLVTEDEGTQVQSAVLEVEDPDGDIHYFLQNKFWTHWRGWSMALYDGQHNLVVLAGPHRREDSCWRDAVRVLKAKGYWGGD
jgi:hypothetical protein